MDWSKKVAVITGASGVLLSAFAKELASKGTKIAIICRSGAEKTMSDIKSVGGTAKVYKCDVLDKEALEKVEEQIFKDFGQYHILINGAGGNMPNANTSEEIFKNEDLNNPDVRTFFALDPKEIQKVFNVNFIGTFLVSQVFAKRMLGVKGATIINFSSMSSYHPMTKVLGYSAAKAAINNFTEWMAVHFAKAGIRVNAIAPGFFLTNQNRTLLTYPDGSLTPRSHKIMNSTPMGRFGEPSDLFGTLLWLCDSDASGFVTGTVIPVDGGFNAYSGV